MKRPLRWLACLLVLFLPLATAASSGGWRSTSSAATPSALPIAVAPMPYQGSGRGAGHRRGRGGHRRPQPLGQFNAMPADRIRQLSSPNPPPTRGAEVDYPVWRVAGQDYLVVGRVRGCRRRQLPGRVRAVRHRQARSACSGWR
jgi:TolB protein